MRPRLWRGFFLVSSVREMMQAATGTGSAAFARCAPFALFIALLALGSFVDEPWLVVARTLLVAGTLAWYWPRYVELHTTAPARRGDWAWAAIAGLAVFIAWIFLDHELIAAGSSPGFRPLLPDGGID